MSRERESRPSVAVPAESWLPAGWVVEGKLRTSGATSGQIDKYWIEPTSGHRFTSKIGVLNFLKTGVLPKKRKSMGNADATKDSCGSSSGKKQMKLPSNKPKTFKFDFSDVPERVNWVSTDNYMDCWTPFNGDEKMADSVAQEWSAAFSYLIIGSDTNRPMF